MQRFIRGMVLAGVAGLVWGCGDDPLVDGAGEGEHVVGYPGALFITPGEVKPMEFELLDENGAAQRTEWTVDNVVGDITVDVDETFIPDYDENGDLGPPDQPARIRVNVTGGNTPQEASFDVTAGGITETFSVRVTPVALAGTFDAPPTLLDTTTFTVAAPFGFEPTATVTSPAGVEFEVTAVDATSITFVPSTVEAGALTISGVTLDYISGASFDFETENTDGIASPFTGQDDPTTTAPAIVGPAAVGDSVVFADGGAIGVDQFYRVSLPNAGTYLFTLVWEGAADEDMYVCNADCTVNLSAFQAATGANPENATVALAAGDYTVYVNLYDAHDEIPHNFRVIVKRTS